MPPRSTAPASNPFASLVGPASGTVGVPTGAETKLYQVPRELIEIARARASAGPSGALTPIAPRPDQDIEATVRAYAESVSAPALREERALDACFEQPAARERVLDEPMLEVSSAHAAEPGLELAQSVLESDPDVAQPLELRRRSRGSGVALAAQSEEPDEAPSSRAWLYYAAGLGLVGAATLALLS